MWRSGWVWRGPQVRPSSTPGRACQVIWQGLSAAASVRRLSAEERGAVTDWLTIEVTLSGTPSTVLEPPPGRLLLCHPDHTFAELADAIDVAFARWDPSPDHEFVMPDQRVISSADGPLPADEVESSAEVTLGEVLRGEGITFSYVFDLGMRWSHRCRVLEYGVDVDEDASDGVVPVLGWGTIPDQHGLVERPADLDEAADDTDFGDEDYEDLDPAEAWRIVRAAIGIERAAGDPPGALHAAAQALRARWPSHEISLVRLAAELEEPLPEEDAFLWVEAAAGIVDPSDAGLLRAEERDGWDVIETADWAGAVIELVRRGPGTAADADALSELIAHCPEVEESDLDPEDEALLRRGLSQVTTLLMALGAIDEEHCLTPLGAWGLPRALRRAWVE